MHSYALLHVASSASYFALAVAALGFAACSASVADATLNGSAGISDHAAGGMQGANASSGSSASGRAAGASSFEPVRAGMGGARGERPAGSSGESGASAGTGSAAQCPASVATAPGERTVAIKVGNAMRTFLQRLPPGYTGKARLPVVIDFHGRGGSGAQQKSASHWAATADQKGVIMIWPDGIDSTWNAGRCCGSAADDVAFVRAIIATLNEQVCIDPKRIYATGCSAGGAMSYKLACDAADVIAAVAPVDFDCAYSPDNTGNTPSCGGCAPSRPISEIQFRGTADALALYEGGVRPGGSNYHAGARRNFAEWGGINQCTGTPAPLTANASCEAYPACAAEAETILCTVQDGAHCASYEAFGIANLAWEILQRHALP